MHTSYKNDCSEPLTYNGGYSGESTEYNNMYNGVKKNKGFYIGRYEAGKENEKVVVKKNKTVYNNISWGRGWLDPTGGAVELSKNFKNGKAYQTSVTSTLVYGAQWDAALQFIDSNYINSKCDTSSYVRNSTGKGHYNATSPIATGSNENYKMKNIYDMAGNVYERTMEAYGGYDASRVSRGGAYTHSGSEKPASERYVNSVTGREAWMGFRIALYLP